jgi:prepilin-type N-terminal cleavage/methylation domain-containing protein
LRKGFTLVEIMVVVLIIAILLAIAVPNFVRARELSRARECVQTLRQIENAKEFYAHENGLSNGAPVVMADLWPSYIRRSTPPDCMGGGNYTVGAVGQTPTCDYGGPIAHQL